MLPSSSAAENGVVDVFGGNHGVDRGGNDHDPVRREGAHEIAGLIAGGGIEDRAVQSGLGQDVHQGREFAIGADDFVESEVAGGCGRAFADAIDGQMAETGDLRPDRRRARRALALVTAIAANPSGGGSVVVKRRKAQQTAP